MVSTSSRAIEQNVTERFRPGPRFYSSALVLIFFSAFIAHVRINGIFACPVTEYAGNHYLGHCETSGYGDYDHGAFWFDLEPIIRRAAQSADVLFVGNSRMQFGFSAPALGYWFATQDQEYYLLGFSHGETANFLGPMLDALQPMARVYIVNADEFFVDSWTGPGLDVLRSEDALARYRAKNRWQTIHRFICNRTAICGNTMAFFRQRETGEWILGGKSVGTPAMSDRALPLDEPRVTEMRTQALDFVSRLGVSRECIIFTYVPPRISDRATIQALAAAVGVPFVSPQLDGLQTFDGSHLDRNSAQRFTIAFFEEAAPLLKRCLADEIPGRGASDGEDAV
jgi:hypothetical protein